MNTSSQLKYDLTNKIINRLNDSLTIEQIQELKAALDIELYKVTLSEEETEIVEYDRNNYYYRLKSFLATKKVEGRSEGTIKRYKDIIIMMLEFFDKPVDQITTEDLRYYLAWYRETRNISLGTLDGMRLVFSSFFKYLYQEQIITYDPTCRLNKIKFTKKVKVVVTDENLELMRVYCDNLRDFAILEFLYATGVRVGEVVKLNRNDINFQTYETIVTGKGSKQRVVKMNARAAIRLKLYLDNRKDDNDALFVNNKAPHKRLTINGLRAALKRIAKKAGVTQNIFPHAFRTKFATDMVAHGAPIDHIALMLGHENINTTKIYSLISEQSITHTYNSCFY